MELTFGILMIIWMAGGVCGIANYCFSSVFGTLNGLLACIGFNLIVIFVLAHFLGV